jgi:hypothetical protein
MKHKRNKIFVADVALVYCIQHSLNQPYKSLIPCRNVAKIGLASKSTKENYFSERLRALHQGSTHVLEVTNWRELPTREDAAAFEQGLHQYMVDNGAESLHNKTNTTGHKEWFVLENINDPDSLIENGFNYLMQQYNQGYLHTRLVRHCEYEIFTDLFEIAS